MWQFVIGLNILCSTNAHFSRFMHVYGWINLEQDKFEVKIQAFFLPNSTYQINQITNLVHEFDSNLK